MRGTQPASSASLKVIRWIPDTRVAEYRTRKSFADPLRSRRRLFRGLRGLMKFQYLQVRILVLFLGIVTSLSYVTAQAPGDAAVALHLTWRLGSIAALNQFQAQLWCNLARFQPN
jgi:hypothetical protein